MLSPLLEHHSTMLKMTAKIAVKMQNLPPWDVDWTVDLKAIGATSHVQTSSLMKKILQSSTNG